MPLGGGWIRAWRELVKRNGSGLLCAANRPLRTGAGKGREGEQEREGEGERERERVRDCCLLVDGGFVHDED